MPLCAQRRETARVGVSHLAHVSPSAYQGPVAADAEPGPLRWPFVVGGALVGGVTAAVIVAHSVQSTDDAMIFPIVSVGAFLAVGMVAGASVGWLVSELVR